MYRAKARFPNICKSYRQLRLGRVPRPHRGNPGMGLSVGRRMGDPHSDNSERTAQQAAVLDHAVRADLQTEGLLDQTLVVPDGTRVR